MDARVRLLKRYPAFTEILEAPRSFVRWLAIWSETIDMLAAHMGKKWVDECLESEGCGEKVLDIVAELTVLDGYEPEL